MWGAALGGIAGHTGGALGGALGAVGGLGIGGRLGWNVWARAGLRLADLTGKGKANPIAGGIGSLLLSIPGLGTGATIGAADALHALFALEGTRARSGGPGLSLALLSLPKVHTYRPGGCAP